MHDRGEVTMLGGAQYKDETCHITYRRHHDCETSSNSHGGTYLDCGGDGDEVIQVVFGLNEDDGIEVINESNNCSPDTDKHGFATISKQLNIGKTSICFNKCFAKSSYTLMGNLSKNFHDVWGGARFGPV